MAFTKVFSHVIEELASASGTDALLYIGPDIPGRVSVVHAVLMCLADNANNSVMATISHDIARSTPGSLDLILSEQFNWVIAAWENGASNARHFPIPGPGLAIAGPQRALFRNDSAETLDLAILVYYTEQRVSMTEYTQLRRQTSYEGTN